MSKSAFGLDENLAAALSYPLGFVTGLVFFVFEKDNKFVRFHALQATMFGMVYCVLRAILKVIPLINWFFPSLLSLGYFLCTVYLIYMAFRGKSFKLPFIGDAAYNQVNK